MVDIESPDLVMRHEELKVNGGKHSYNTYRPHLSLKYSPSDADLELLKRNPLPIINLMLGNESFDLCK